MSPSQGLYKLLQNCRHSVVLSVIFVMDFWLEFQIYKTINVLFGNIPNMMKKEIEIPCIKPNNKT